MAFPSPVHHRSIMSVSIHLHNAILADNFTAVQNALLKPPIPTLQDLEKALELAMPNASLSILKLLIQVGADLTRHALRNAMIRGHTEVFELLVEAGWDINSPNAVHMAIHHDIILRWLLERGADASRRSTYDYGQWCADMCTPMAQAARMGGNGVVPLQTLLEFGVEIDPLALLWAVNGTRRGRRSVTTMKILIEAGADVNYVSKRWSTPLSQAARCGDIDQIQMLLEAGADPRVRHDWHNKISGSRTVRLRCSADFCGKKVCMENAVDCARRHGHDEALRILEKWVKKLEEHEKALV
ncbi:ankyrin repeat-containing domain protein [Paraphoma chrysanthemicola]|nr:ankyrin repeat-containing domain protein [Paraphoma chrysanthemicola]